MEDLIGKVELYFDGAQTYMSYENLDGEYIRIETDSPLLTLQLMKAEMEKLSSVNTLRLVGDLPAEQIIPGNLHVKHLEIEGGNSDYNYRNAILQLAIGNLESLKYSLHGEASDREIFSLYQIMYAKQLELECDAINDEQLLEFNASYMKIGPQTSISSAGLNAFFKKNLWRLYSAEVFYQFTYPNGYEQYSEIIAGMEVKSMENIVYQTGKLRQVRLASGFENYVLSITFSDSYVIARREPNVESEPRQPVEPEPVVAPEPQEADEPQIFFFGEADVRDAPLNAFDELMNGADRIRIHLINFLFD